MDALEFCVEAKYIYYIQKYHIFHFQAHFLLGIYVLRRIQKIIKIVFGTVYSMCGRHGHRFVVQNCVLLSHYHLGLAVIVRSR